MSTYDAPYQFFELSAMPDNTLASKVAQVDIIKELFRDAGWMIADVPSLMVITTSGPPTFTVCELGVSNHAFWQMGTGYAAKFDNDGCLDADGSKDIGYSAIDGFDEDIYSYIFGGGGNITLDKYKDDLAPGIQFLELNDRDNVQLLNDNLAKASSLVTGVTPIIYSQEEVSSGVWRTIAAYENPTIASISGQYGGQLNTVITHHGGYGFLARSASNRVDGNAAEIYVFIETRDPVNAARSNQIRFAMRKYKPAVLLEEGELYFTDAPLIHPLVLHWDDVGEPTSIANAYTGIKAHAAIKGVIGPYWFDIVGEPESSNATAVYGGALRIKPLEGETGVPNIRKLLIQGGTNQATSNSNKSLFFGPRVRDAMIFNVDEVDFSEPLGYYGQVEFILSTLSNTSGANLTGIVWPGGVANLFEPWVGWNWYDPDETSTQIIPLVGMLPNAIIPARGNDLGNPPSDESSFFWDGQWWKYWQQDNHPTTPATGLAYVVEPE